ncbi:MAG: cellobiose phosphorylase [Candidatus Omnitrophica bacterium]|nr:cellobiose phosphorylase [Candidatus Omnitrophota bacterium]MDD5547213.1 cellobiose phosphorylase [Candidatus Omnitrophota bacterium]
MIYRFIDDKGTFTVKDPHKYNLYFPLADKDGKLLSSISPNLGGDIKRDNDHFLTPPASIEDVRNNLFCRRDFFIKIGNEIIRLSYPHDDVIEAGFLYHKVTKQAHGLEIEVLNFIPFNTAVEVMRVRVTNKRGKEVEITPTSFIPLYGRSEKNIRDHRHVSSLLNRVYLDRYGISLKPTMIFDEKGHTENKTDYSVFGCEDNGKAPAGQFPTIGMFCGEGDLIFPDAVEKYVKPAAKKLPESDGKEACAAFRFNRKKLKKGGRADYILVMGIADDRKGVKKIFKGLNSPSKVEKSLEATKRYWQQYLSKLEFDFNDGDFNNWLLWVKMQPTLRKLFGNSFLPHYDYGKGGRGWRDIWQDALTLLLTEPEKARDFIFDSFRGVRLDGSNATVIAKDGKFTADRNRISRVWMDHGIWPYLTARLYIQKTGDSGFMLNKAEYFRDYQLKRAKFIDKDFNQPDFIQRDNSGRIYRGSVLEHILVQNVVQFFNVGEHNVIRLENADWDDGLDMAADRGESVAFSFMYAYNLRDICVILEEMKKRHKSVKLLTEFLMLLDNLGTPVDYDNYKEKQRRLEEYLESCRSITGEAVEVDIDDLIADLDKKADHLFAWLRKKEWLEGAGFFNGYYDNKGRRVEGKSGDKVRMKLASQVFAIMSGCATDSQIRKMWQSIKKYLKDPGLGGFRLGTDFRTVYMDLGRAFGFAYGDKENGAFFNHMNVMLANALYKRGFIKEGREVFDSVYKMSTGEAARIYPMIPEYFNNEGRGLYFYLTGSASWYIYTLIDEVLGVKFNFGKAALKPKLVPDDFHGGDIEVRYNLKGKAVRHIFKR